MGTQVAQSPSVAGVNLRIEELNSYGNNAPLVVVGERIEPDPTTPAVRYQRKFVNGARLDALLLNKRSEEMVVCFHGALMRNKYRLPRFEWLRTFRSAPFTSMYLSDPSLYLDRKLQLAWFTGWRDIDIHHIIANWVSRVAECTGAKKIVFTGSSGGGFASLQTSFLVPGSCAVAFNPQTDISAYLVSGTKFTAQRQYLQVVWPDIYAKLEDNIVIDPSWKCEIDDRVSVIDRYRQEMKNYVHFFQKVEDFHYEQHYKPFVDVIRGTTNEKRVHTHLYHGERSHRPPTHDLMLQSVISAFKEDYVTSGNVRL